MRRLSISFNVEWGKDEEAGDVQPQGDVFTAAERRPAETHGGPSIGFGRVEED